MSYLWENVHQLLALVVVNGNTKNSVLYTVKQDQDYGEMEITTFH